MAELDPWVLNLDQDALAWDEEVATFFSEQQQRQQKIIETGYRVFFRIANSLPNVVLPVPKGNIRNYSLGDLDFIEVNGSDPRISPLAGLTHEHLVYNLAVFGVNREFRSPEEQLPNHIKEIAHLLLENPNSFNQRALFTVYHDYYALGEGRYKVGERSIDLVVPESYHVVNGELQKKPLSTKFKATELSLVRGAIGLARVYHQGVSSRNKLESSE